MDIAEIEHIIKVLKENGITEFELKREDGELKLKREQHSTGLASGTHGDVHLQPLTGPYPVAVSSSPVELPDSRLLKVESPIVGTFYRKPSPDKDSFVSQGDFVKKGQTLCIIEAMKLMNEIEAPYSGRVEKILPQDGEVVEFGEVIFLIDPS